VTLAQAGKGTTLAKGKFKDSTAVAFATR